MAQDRVDTLRESVATAWRSEGSVTPAQTLDGERLRRMSSMNVSDAVRYFSGVQVKDYGGIGGLKTVNVRSLGAQQTGVFYDGVMVDNAQNGQVDLGRFGLADMESISLYNGQKTDFLQSAQDFASASTVYLRSRVPSFAPGRRHNLMASLSAGSFATVEPSLRWEYRVTDRLSMSLDASYLYTSGRYKFTYSKLDGYDTTAVRQNGDVNALRATAGLYGAMKDGSWRVKAYLYSSRRGYPGAFVRQTPGYFKNEDRQWDRNMFLQGSFDRRWGWYRLSMKAKYADDWLRYVSDPRKDVSTMYVDNSYSSQEAYVSLANGFEPFGWWYLSLSGDWKLNHMESDMASFSAPTRNTALTALSSTWHWDAVKVQASLLHTFVHDAVSSGDTKDRSRFTPSVSVSVKPLASEDFRLRAFYKNIYRMPTLNDLYYVFIGNRDLSPEFTTQYDLGLTWGHRWDGAFLRSVELNDDFYFNQIENKIVAVPATNQFQWTMMNLGYVEVLGSDLNAMAQMCLGHVRRSDMLADLRLTYTWQRARDLTDPSSEWYGGQVAYIPVHSLSAVAGLSWGRYSLLYSFLYTGERYDSSANIAENRLQPWYTSDLTMSGSWAVGEHELRARVDVNNLFNQQYEVVRCYPMPGINFRVCLSFVL